MNTHTDTIFRSNLYKLLSTGFRYPDPEIFKTFQNGEFLDELMYNISSISGLNALMLEYSGMAGNHKDDMKGMTMAQFEIEFTRIFDAGTPVPLCPPNESHYCRKPGSVVMLEVSEFYNFFGMRMSQEEGKREFPDHICAELEFLHFLTFREEEALGEDKLEEYKGYLLAQKDFLERHLIQWIPEFCLKLQDSASLTFYVRLGQITSRFISSEFELVTANLHSFNPKNKILASAGFPD
ncbi:MAG: molecular chaperone TorD family protein [Candidatus Methanoperedens sp.]|nr:molecular chaperone TorD family protein [Candidatus Methanoperedens sp.]